MAVINISLPDLGTDLALIASSITTIEGNVPDNLLTFIKPRFIFKGSEDCSTFYLDDVTDYQEVSVVDVANIVLNTTYIYRTSCGDIIPCSSETMTPNGRLEFENSYGDGEYCVSIEMIYTIPNIDPMLPPDIYTEINEECLTQNCCQNKLIDLRKEIACCMAAASCKINEFKCIGRSYVKLTSRYLKMSNLLWVIDNTKSSCEDYNSLACLFKKI